MWIWSYGLIYIANYVNPQFHQNQCSLLTVNDLSLSTLFKSYQDDKGVIVNGSMQLSTTESPAGLCLYEN